MKTLVAIPCMDMMHTDFVRSLLGLRVTGEVQYTFAQASLVYDGRNTLANAAIDGGFDQVLWLDSDMLFTPELLEQLQADLDEAHACVSALYFSRKAPVKPVIYKSCFLDTSGETPMPRADCFFDYPENAVFPVAACGFGAVLMRTELLQKVRDRFGLPFSPALGFGEDMSFCMRCTELGEPILCDSRIKPGHVGLCVFNEAAYKLRLEREKNGGTP